MKMPRILLCAGASGSGKTLLTCGILQALINRGIKPASFKCGPDYIDPMFHKKVLGTVSGNLDTFFLDDESLTAYLEAHKRLGLQADYLAKIVEEKKLERDFIISRYDDLLYVLRTQKTCKPLYEIIIRELSQLIVHPGARDIFYSISMGESIEKVAGWHRITYDRALQIYNSHLRGLKVRKNVLAIYRKHIIDARFQSLADKSKNINLNQEERVLQLSVG